MPERLFQHLEYFDDTCPRSSPCIGIGFGNGRKTTESSGEHKRRSLRQRSTQHSVTTSLFFA